MIMLYRAMYLNRPNDVTSAARPSLWAKDKHARTQLAHRDREKRVPCQFASNGDARWIDLKSTQCLMETYLGNLVCLRVQTAHALYSRTILHRFLQDYNMQPVTSSWYLWSSLTVLLSKSLAYLYPYLMLWNNLPDNLRTLDSRLKSVKSKLKTFLHKHSYLSST